MVFKDQDNQLVKNLWPDNIGHLKDEPKPLADCCGWQAVPDNLEDLCEWAYLAENEQATD
jgi:hypothetical protein